MGIWGKTPSVRDETYILTVHNIHTHDSQTYILTAHNIHTHDSRHIYSRLTTYILTAHIIYTHNSLSRKKRKGVCHRLDTEQKPVLTPDSKKGRTRDPILSKTKKGKGSWPLKRDQGSQSFLSKDREESLFTPNENEEEVTRTFTSTR